MDISGPYLALLCYIVYATYLERQFLLPCLHCPPRFHVRVGVLKGERQGSYFSHDGDKDLGGKERQLYLYCTYTYHHSQLLVSTDNSRLYISTGSAPVPF